MLLQKMTEIQYRGFIRQGIFHLPVRQGEPILHAVNAKHVPQRHWLTASPPGPGVMGLNVRQQNRPGHYPFHFA